MIAGQELFFNLCINKSGNIPVYLQLYNYLRSLIVNHSIKLGDMFPSESDLCAHYGVSRTTMRQAFTELQKEDLIVRIKGKGTFVSEPKLNRPINNLYSFSDEMKTLGLETRNIVRSFMIKPATPQQKSIFKREADDEMKVFEIVRLRLVNETPLTLETAYIPVDVCPVLSKPLIESSSLYKILHQYAGIIPVRASEIYSSVNLSRSIAHLLGCSTRTSAFMYDRISYDIQEKAFEIARIYVRGDRCRYEVDLQANNVSFLRRVDNQ